MGFFSPSGKHNIAFVSYLLSGKLEECVELLKLSGRVPEAAFFSRTYLPRFELPKPQISVEAQGSRLLPYVLIQLSYEIRSHWFQFIALSLILHEIAAKFLKY